MNTKVYIRPAKIEVDIHKKMIDRWHKDSFWYDGPVADVKLGTRKVTIVAMGEIDMYRNDGSGESYQDDKARRYAKRHKLTDKTLNKKFEFDNSNWFELTEVDKDYNHIFTLNAVGTYYDEAIEMAINYLTE